MIEEPDAGDRGEFPRLDRLIDRPFEGLIKRRSCLINFALKPAFKGAVRMR